MNTTQIAPNPDTDYRYRTALGMHGDALSLLSEAARDVPEEDAGIIVISETLLDAAISNFLALCDGGDSLVENPEYYRGDFEMLCDTFVHGGSDHRAEWLASRIQSHSEWRGGDTALPL